MALLFLQRHKRLLFLKLTFMLILDLVDVVVRKNILTRANELKFLRLREDPGAALLFFRLLNLFP